MDVSLNPLGALKKSVNDGCELCRSDGGQVLWRGPQVRVVRVDDADYPGYLRLIWNAHVREWSDLARAERAHCLEALAVAERLVRDATGAEKMNIASLGNLVPHLHWHLIARFRDDAHFPQPIWGTRQRQPAVDGLARRREAMTGLGPVLAAALDGIEAAGATVRDKNPI